ncbi:MAG: chemotaxis protein CheD [Methanobacteriota archaeon]|nr:MAG: chemotaxis protein CheD [Euryarchaeota archaeon]
MNDAKLVGIAQYATAKAPEQLCCLGLGSCVGVFLYDPSTKIGGVVHALLPRAPNGSILEAKYADTGIRLLQRRTVTDGAFEHRIIAKLTGGAQMFKDLNLKMGDIGRQNVLQSRRTLGELGISIVSEDVEGERGRSAYYSLGDGSVRVRKAFGSDIVI